MDEMVKVKFSRELIAEMLRAVEPQTLRLVDMGKIDDELCYSPRFVVETMVPDLPEPWVFDGYRRVYDDGMPTRLWQARAINLSDMEIEEETGRAKASFTVGQGTTMVEARDTLLGLFKVDGRDALRRFE